MPGRPPARRLLIIAGVLILALALRIGEVQGTSYRPVNDAGSYLKLASQIADTGSYSTSRAPGSGAAGTRGPSAYFPPGFPYLLAGVDLIDGHLTPRGGAIHPARLSQAVIGTITVALVGLVAYEAFGALVGYIALVLAAVYPVLIELSALLVAENLFTLLVLAAVWSMLRAARSAHPYRWMAGAGAATGLAILTHVNGVVVLLPLGFAAWRLRRTTRAELRHPLLGLGLLLAVTALMITPWAIRNAVELHRFIPVSDETGITLVGTYNPASAAYRPVAYKWRFYSGIPGERRLAREARHLTEPALSSKLETRALNYIGDHPLAPAEVVYHNSLRLLELEGSFAWRASAKAQGLSAGTARIGVTSFWILALLALAGVFTPAARTAPRWLWLLPALLWLSVAAVNVETPRFREPVDPFLIFLAACAIATVGRAAAARLARAPVGRQGLAAVARRPGELVEMVERLA